MPGALVSPRIRSAKPPNPADRALTQKALGIPSVTTHREACRAPPAPSPRESLQCPIRQSMSGVSCWRQPRQNAAAKYPDLTVRKGQSAARECSTESRRVSLLGEPTPKESLQCLVPQSLPKLLGCRLGESNTHDRTLQWTSVEWKHQALRSKADLRRVGISAKRIWLRVTNPASSKRRLSHQSKVFLRYFNGHRCLSFRAPWQCHLAGSQTLLLQMLALLATRLGLAASSRWATHLLSGSLRCSAFVLFKN